MRPVLAVSVLAVVSALSGCIAPSVLDPGQRAVTEPLEPATLAWRAAAKNELPGFYASQEVRRRRRRTHQSRLNNISDDGWRPCSVGILGAFESQKYYLTLTPTIIICRPLNLSNCTATSRHTRAAMTTAMIFTSVTFIATNLARFRCRDEHSNPLVETNSFVAVMTGARISLHARSSRLKRE